MCPVTLPPEIQPVVPLPQPPPWSPDFESFLSQLMPDRLPCWHRSGLISRTCSKLFSRPGFQKAGCIGPTKC